ncbi:putative modified peptide [Duganella sp. FT135W]|uniref:Putative modified peptide n=1 Tax=Duganella flavida TaxID=2692175 RepID=A0A6L8KI80_9BURK|nr:NHLP-related RiPP peptide [Duganella flavida]MYM26457.1 putative modified peptide [Duganella flavida]
MHTSSELSAIIDKLAGDTQFREHLHSDPVAALASLGVTLQPEHVPENISLPSAASLAADKGELQAKLETTASMLPFLLSGNVA